MSLQPTIEWLTSDTARFGKVCEVPGMWVAPEQMRLHFQRTIYFGRLVRIAGLIALGEAWVGRLLSPTTSLACR